MAFWTEYLSECKTRLSAVSRSLFSSRNRWKEVAQQRHEQVLELRQHVSRLTKECESRRLALAVANQKNNELGQELERMQNYRVLELSVDPPLPFHQYGPRMISLCVNVARLIGLRPSIRALREIFDWLDVKVCLPTWQAVRTWMQRIGIARTRKIKKVDGRIWIVDHSNQIGKEKVLLILSIAPKDLPAKGKTLQLSDVEVLAWVPGTSWKREDVARVYQETAEKYGDPRAILSDGAVELRESIDYVDRPGKTKPISLRDLKHFLSNRLEALLANDKDFKSYYAELVKTKCAIQQTELSYLIPPATKSKARFMNLKPLIDWGKRVLWYADQAGEQAKDGIRPERFEEKLGWIRDIETPLQRWDAYHQVISASLAWIHENGLSRGTARNLEKHLQALPGWGQAKSLANETTAFLRSQEIKLKPGERLWLSTEIIESAFSVYKQFEGQHSKGGFTTLLPTMATLLKRATAKQVSSDLKQVPVRSVTDWIAKHLPNTNQAKRRRMANAHRNSIGMLNTKNRATKRFITT